MTRSRSERISAVRQRLAAEPNVWVATASPDGQPHLVPLSLAWLDGTVVVATPSDTVTARNIARTGRARLSLEDTVDVVVIDAAVDAVALDAAESSLVEQFAGRVGWDPRDNPADWVFLVATPRRVQAWNSEAEIDGRTLMRNGVWL